MKKNKIISISFSLMLILMLIFGLFTTPVLGAVGFSLHKANIGGNFYIHGQHSSLLWSKDGTYYAWTSVNSYVYVYYDTDDTECCNQATINSGIGSSCAWSETDDNILYYLYYSNQNDAKLYKLNVLTNTTTQLQAHCGFSTIQRATILVGYNDDYILGHTWGSDNDGTTKVWDSDGNPTQTFSNLRYSAPSNSRNYAMGFSDDFETIYVMDLQTNLEVRNVSTGTIVDGLDTGYIIVRSDSPCFYRDGYFYFTLYNGSASTTCVIGMVNEELTNYALIKDIGSAYNNEYVSFDVTYDNEYVIYSGYNTGSLGIKMFEFATGDLVSQINSEKGYCSFKRDGSKACFYDNLDSDQYIYNTAYSVDAGGCGLVGEVCIGTHYGYISRPYDNGAYLETSFDALLSGKIRSVDLTIEGGSNVGELTDWELWVNNVYCGHPDCLTGGGYAANILRWNDMSVDCDMECPVFEWKRINKPFLADYQVHTGAIGEDLNGDGAACVYSHGNANLRDGILSGCTDLCDLAMVFCYDPDVPPEEDAYDIENDTIDFSGSSYAGIHPTYDLETYYQYTSVFITYNVITLANDNYMYIYDDNWNLVGQSQGYSPMLLITKDRTIGFVPYNTGNYTVTIERNSVEVANETFYAYANTNDYIVYTIPSKTFSDIESYQVHYIYNNSVKDGVVAVFYEADQVSTFNANQGYYYINSGSPTTGCVAHYPTMSYADVHYWRIFVQISNGTYEPVGSVHKHYIENPYSDIFIDHYYDGMTIDTECVTQVIEWRHKSLGADVAIYVNNNFFRYVTDDQYGTEYYECCESGAYISSLRINLNGSWFEIANDTWYVGGAGDIPDEEPEDGAEDWADAIIPDEFNPYVGAIIVGVFACIPFGLSASTGIEFPAVGYGFFAVLGLSLSTALGFFPMWIIYALIVSLIAGAVILYFGR